MSTLGTLGQHEFAFGFCGSIGVEISRISRPSFAAGIRALRALLFYSATAWPVALSLQCDTSTIEEAGVIANKLACFGFISCRVENLYSP